MADIQGMLGWKYGTAQQLLDRMAPLKGKFSTDQQACSCRLADLRGNSRAWAAMHMSAVMTTGFP